MGSQWVVVCVDEYPGGKSRQRVQGYGQPVCSGLCRQISWRGEPTAGFIGCMQLLAANVEDTMQPTSVEFERVQEASHSGQCR